MKQTLFFASVVLLLTSCGKDKFETKPQLKLKSVSTKEVTSTTPFSVTIEYTDKEGDVSDSFFIVRQRLNLHGPATLAPLPYKMPNFPRTSKGEIEVNLRFFEDLTLNLEPIRIPGSDPSRNEFDTLRLKFVAKDKGEHVSDTLVLNDVIVERL